MCAIEDAEPWTVVREAIRTARKLWRCCECRRTIPTGERHHFARGLSDGEWSEYRWCIHCEAAAEWMRVVCNGCPYTMLAEELREHWADGYQSLSFARLIAGMRWKWHDGRDEVPTGVGELARQMLAESVLERAR